MQPPVIKRRSFLGYLLAVVAFIRCKKDQLIPGKSSTPGKTVDSDPLPAVITDDYLGQYTVTEIGPNLQDDPTFNTIINGYTDKVSYNPGDTVNVYLSGPASSNTAVKLIDTKRNTVQTISTPIVTQQIKSSKPWVDGFMYDKTFSFVLPANFKSGIYSWVWDIPFVCKGTNLSPDIVVVYPSNTMNAYNYAGGKSLYAPDFQNRATVLSFQRSNTLGFGGFYQWIDYQPYNINYIADSDLDDYTQIQNAKLVIITGHSEYWTRQARLNIDKFVDSGKNLLMLSGNNMWWQVRYNKNKNAMICYKDNNGNPAYDDSVDPLGHTIYSTVNWGTPRVDYSIMSSLGTDYRYGGYGNQFADRWNGFKIVQDKSPLFKGTGLKNGDILSMPTTEYEGAPVVELFPPGSLKIPVIDNTVLNFNKVELIAFDFADNSLRRDKLGFGTFMVCKKKSTSGTIVNASSFDWCVNVNVDKGLVKTITKNMIDLSLTGNSLFTETGT